MLITTDLTNCLMLKFTNRICFFSLLFTSSKLYISTPFPVSRCLVSKCCLLGFYHMGICFFDIIVSVILVSEYLLVLMYFYHSPEDKEIRGCSNFNILHRAYDGVHLVAIITHHRTGIYEIMLS